MARFCASSQIYYISRHNVNSPSWLSLCFSFWWKLSILCKHKHKLYLKLLDNSSSDGDSRCERAFFVYIGALFGNKGGLETEPNILEVAVHLRVFISEEFLGVEENCSLFLESSFVLKGFNNESKIDYLFFSHVMYSTNIF